jgi:hypothetical protein
MSYAKQTTVPVDRSRLEIERLLHAHGADEFMHATNRSGRAMIVFTCQNRHVRFELPMPNQDDPSYQARRRWRNGVGYESAASRTEKNLEQERRRRWRALLLVVKAKLEAVASGISTFEQEFLAHIVLPDGRTVGDHTVPAIEAAYASGRMQPLLGPGGGR